MWKCIPCISMCQLYSIIYKHNMCSCTYELMDMDITRPLGDHFMNYTDT